MFKTLTGYGPGQCGDISFLLLVSFINKNSIIETDSYVLNTFCLMMLTILIGSMLNKTKTPHLFIQG